MAYARAEAEAVLYECVRQALRDASLHPRQVPPQLIESIKVQG